MATYTFDLLLDALSADGTSYILGAGASSPHVPTLSDLPRRVALYSSRLGSFAAGGLPDSPLRRLIAPMIEKALTATTLEEWKPSAMTPATIAVILEHVITTAHWLPLPQYEVFRLIPHNSSVVSFNWDGLALARCHQSDVIHPHGIVRPRLLLSSQLDEVLDDTQLLESPDAREWVLPGLVMPGEEDSPKLAAIREKVFNLWLHASQAIIIGYSFGLGSALDYDRVWLDTFAEAFRINSRAAIHVLAPNADWLRGGMAERLNRTVNVHAWPLNWHALSRALLQGAREYGSMRLAELRAHRDTLERLYRAALESPVAIA